MLGRWAVVGGGWKAHKPAFLNKAVKPVGPLKFCGRV